MPIESAINLLSQSFMNLTSIIEGVVLSIYGASIVIVDFRNIIVSIFSNSLDSLVTYVKNVYESVAKVLAKELIMIFICQVLIAYKNG